MSHEKTERPILLSGPMVIATLRDIDPKWQTRRVVKLPPWVAKHTTIIQPEGDGFRVVTQADESGAILADQVIRCPYGKPGDRLWVRETFAVFTPQYSVHDEYDECEGKQDRENNSYSVVYAADKKNFPDRWRPAIYLPRWASRLTLEIVKVRVERVQNISEEDAKAEGALLGKLIMGNVLAEYREGSEWAKEAHSYREGFHFLWNSINNARGFGWEKNPWVWVIEFKKVCERP